MSAASQNNKLKIGQRSLFWGGTIWPPAVIIFGWYNLSPVGSAALVKGKVTLSTDEQNTKSLLCQVSQAASLSLIPGSGLHRFFFGLHNFHSK